MYKSLIEELRFKAMHQPWLCNSEDVLCLAHALEDACDQLQAKRDQLYGAIEQDIENSGAVMSGFLNLILSGRLVEKGAVHVEG